MHHARKFMLLAFTVVTVLALTASSASAQPEATVEGGAHCGDVVADGLHAYTNDCHLTGVNASNVELRALFGIMYLCDVDFQANIDENGSGFIYNLSSYVPGTGTDPCGAQPCKEPGGAMEPWPMGLTDETRMELTMCLTGAFGVIVNCHVAQINLTNITHDSAEAKTASYPTSHTFCESDSTNAILGHWDLATEAPGIELD